MIYIDDRIGSAEIAQYLPIKLRTVTHMDYGDGWWFGKGPDGPCPIGFERKTIGDLVACIQNGRLSGHQLIGLVNNYSYRYIIVEGKLNIHKSGDLYLSKHRRVPARDIFNYLNTLQQICRVDWIHTNNLQATANWILYTYRWWQKDWDKHHAHKQFFHSPPPKVFLFRPTFLTRVLKEFKGVSWERAQALAARFQTLRNLCNATVEDLKEVDGVGSTIAASIISEIDSADCH